MNPDGDASETDDDTLSAPNRDGKTPEASQRAASRHVPHTDSDLTGGETTNPLPEQDRPILRLHTFHETPEPLGSK